MLFTPTLVEPAPWYFYVIFAVGLFLYQTADNMDGTQARKTGTSSPLGEMVDHCFDALNTTITAVTTAAVMRLGVTPHTGFIILTGIVPFYCSTWEEYHTGTLYLGYLNGPVEGILTVVFAGLATALAGSDFWLADANALLQRVGLASSYFDGYRFNEFAAIVMVLPIAVLALTAIFNVLWTGKVSLARICLQLMPFVAFKAAFMAWYYCDWATWQEDPFPGFLVCTLLFGRMVGKIILAHLLKQSFPMLNYTLVIPLALAANAYNRSAGLAFALPVAPRTLAWTAALVSAAIYGHMAHAIADGFCRQLKINVFTIPYKKVSAKAE